MLKSLRSSSELKNAPEIGERPVLKVGSVGGGESARFFRVMQFNTLAKALSSPEESAFERLEEGALLWPARRARLLEEVAERDAHAVALEEVDDFAFFEARLAPLGYVGFHAPKPSSPCLRMRDNIGPDGTAVFVKQGGNSIALKNPTSFRLSLLLSFCSSNTIKRKVPIPILIRNFSSAAIDIHCIH